MCLQEPHANFESTVMGSSFPGVSDLSVPAAADNFRPSGPVSAIANAQSEVEVI